MRKNIFLSIIIPMYNTENYIEKCLNSLNNQINKDFQVILVDDGSQDNSFKIAKNYLKNKDLKYKIFHHSNSGVSKTRNFALEKCKGEYIMFLDSDDYVSFNLIEKLKETCENKKVSCIYFDYERVSENGLTLWRCEKKHTFNTKPISGKKLLEKVINGDVSISMSNIIFKREIIEKNNMKFVEEFYNGEDQNFIFKTLLKCNRVRYVKETLFYYVMRKSSVSHSISVKNLTFIDALEDLSEEVKNDYELKNLILNKQMFENIKYNFHMISKIARIEELMVFLKDEKVRKYCSKYIDEINYFNSKDRIYIYLLKYYPRMLARLLILKERIK